MQFPQDEEGFSIENQAYLGDTGILVHPVVKKDVEVAEFYIADAQVFFLSNPISNEMQPYYDYFDFTMYEGKGMHKVPAPLGRIPLLVRGGNIIPRKDRIRGSSGRMTRDPYTLFITLSNEVPLPTK
jgi:mannosyl-oligosaccharide alpha-1,3-glucosidase